VHRWPMGGAPWVDGWAKLGVGGELDLFWRREGFEK
jgi:hypothetical protein